MKKFFSCIVALFAAAFMYAVQIGQLNPYAYAVVPTQTDSTVEISYKLNAPADSSFVVIYRDDVEVAALPLADNTLGQHNATINRSQLSEAGSYTFALRVHGTSNAAPLQLREVKEGRTDTTALCYAFYHPKGVAIDCNPSSAYFGRILTDEGMEDTPDEGYQSAASGDKDGIYAFDPAFQPIANGNQFAFRGGLNFSTRMSNGSTRAYTPYRIRISKDGRIFVSMQDDARSPLYEVSPDLQTWTPIFNGTMNDGVMLTADGEYITGVNCGMDVRGEGENLEIIMLNTNISGMNAYNGKGLTIATYKLGTATSWNGPATTADTLRNIVGNGVVPVIGNCGVTFDEDIDGYWYIGNRSDAINQRSLVHVNAAGQVDWALSNSDSTLFSLNGNGLNGGGNARIQDGLFMIGTGQRMSGTGHLQIFDITYDNNGNVPALTKKWELDLIGISRNLNDFALDPAHNLYTIGNSNEKIVPVALPYSGVVETPMATTIVVEGSETPAAGVVYAYANAGQAEQQNVEIPCQGGKILFGASSSKWEKKAISGYDTDSIYAYKLDSDAKADGSNTKYVRCLLNSPLHAGDKIVISGFAGSNPKNNLGYLVTTDRSATDTIGYAPSTKKNIWEADTIVVPAEFEGLYEFFVTRMAGNSIYFHGAQVLSEVAPLTGRRIAADEVIYLHAAHVEWWQNDNAVQTAWFISATGDTTTITGVEHANAEYVGFTMPATGTFATVKFGRGNESTIWNTTGDIALEGTTENCVMEFANNSAEAVWGHFDDSAPVQVTYKIKHPWGGGSWTWKDLTEDTDGTWYIADIYGGAGCNVDPKVLGKDWISSPTLVNEPASGDSCLFVVNPLATTEAEIITITKLGSTDTVPVPPTPVDTLRLYEIGNNQDWDPTAAIEMTATADSIFEGDFAFTADTIWFAFITVKPETADWNLVNANRYGGATNNELVLNGTYNLAKGEYGFKANSGEYHIVVNIPAMTMTIQKKTSEGLNDMKADDQVMKIYENGQIYIIRNGVRYTAAGAKVE